MFDLTGRRALITGAGQNVGAGIARALAAHGAHVVVNDLVAERAEAVAAELDAAHPGRATAAPFDVTDRDAVLAAIERIGPIDIAVSNAGTPRADRIAPFHDLEPSDWDAMIRLNVYGLWHLAHAVLGPMRAAGWGRIITIASGAGTAGTRIGVSPYATAKGGAIAFTRTLALEEARTGITANSLALGMMATGDADLDAELGRRIPVGRVGTPDDIGAACAWLASDEASWVTGQTIEINGGAITT